MGAPGADSDGDAGFSLTDRQASASDREDLSHDDVTGVYLRRAGLFELDREISRARRSNQPLTLAFVDVDGLKAVNDSRGHAAGDSLLREIANVLKEALRSYDLIIRYGGDEFLCALTGLTIADAAERMADVNAALSDAAEHGSVTIGLAELQTTDSLETLAARADAALYRARED